MSEKEIKKLINDARQKNPDAFTKLMKLYMSDMYRVAISILRNDEDVADAIQDTILTCWEKMETLRESKYFKTWMTRILMNKCFDIRDTYKNETSYDETTDVPIYDHYNIELKEALRKLDEKYRIPLVLYYGEGYRIKEIANILKIPANTVQTRLDRGRKQLAKSYGIENERGC